MKARLDIASCVRMLTLGTMIWVLVQGAAMLSAQTPDAVPGPAPVGGVTPAPLPEAGETPVTLGDGAAKAENGALSTLNLWDVMRAGGPVMWLIAACSFMLVVFIFERTISLRTSRVIPKPFVQRFIDQLREGQLDREQALGLCEGNQSPIAEVFAAAVKKWGKPCVEVEQAIIDVGERVANGLRRYIRVFNAVYTGAPLLGLLGTVLGMIKTFGQVAGSNAMGKPQHLAQGISEALLCTAFGLFVSIPALFAYTYFVGRVDRLVMEIDALSQRVANAISSDGWREPATRMSKADRRARSAKAMATTPPDDEDDDA